MNDIPQELRFKPTPLVAIAGATPDIYQTIDKSTSTAVVEAKKSNPIFRFLPIVPKDFIIPPRNEAEKNATYNPDGILPTGWFSAICHRIPCAIVYIVEFDASDFKAREYEHFGSIDLLRYV